jgi:hypothetical protein
VSETKSNVVKVRVEGAPKNVTKVVEVIRSKLRVVDESEIVVMSSTKARRYLVVLVGQDGQAE